MRTIGLLTLISLVLTVLFLIVGFLLRANNYRYAPDFLTAGLITGGIFVLLFIWFIIKRLKA